MSNIFIPIPTILSSHSDHEAQPWGGAKADKNGGAGAEPPLTFILLNSRLTVRRPLGSLIFVLSFSVFPCLSVSFSVLASV